MSNTITRIKQGHPSRNTQYHLHNKVPSMHTKYSDSYSNGTIKRHSANQYIGHHWSTDMFTDNSIGDSDLLLD